MSTALGATRRRRVRPLAGLIVAAACSAPAAAFAHSRGIAAEGCEGCHGSGTKAEVSLTASPAAFAPGAMVTFTLSIKAASIKSAGAFVTAGGTGTLVPIASEGMLVSDDGLAHNGPKTATAGQATFQFQWQAPSAPGGVQLRAYVVAANGNGSSGGDAPGQIAFEATYGCAGRQFLWDGDRDGYGSSAYPTRLGCADAPPPSGYAATDGDCDERDPAVHPAAAESCNGKDDDCNGQVDENAPAVTLWPDLDGDGYYASQTGTPVMGCVGTRGYAALAGDCAPSDPAIHPGAPELCNGEDDNCDGHPDEGVRPRCGVGWCERRSLSCNAADCVAGAPERETCNNLDDDCNGVVDDGVLCPNDTACIKGVCRPLAGAASPDAGSPGLGTTDGPARSVDGAPAGAGGAGSPAARETGAGCAGCQAGGRAASGRGAAAWIALAALVLAHARRLRRRS